MTNKLIIFILIIGVIYRLILTSNGNFLFNMDNARDMVDVREMVVLKKLRLTGPTSAIEGFYNGPAWYYLLAIPFILSGGDPYGAIVLEIFLWAVGGFFLLKLVSIWGSWILVPIGILWVASNYVVLANLYAFNPNPVILLTPLFIYLLVKYFQTKKMIFSIATWFLAGLFFNLEMNFGVFTPPIIIISAFLTRKLDLLKQKTFWLGFGVFIVMLAPQVIFDLRHEFIMTKAVIRHLSESTGTPFTLTRIENIFRSYFSTFQATMMNHKLLTWLILILMGSLIVSTIKKIKDLAVLISLTAISVPFLGYLILPVTVNPWHLGAQMAAAAILIAYLLHKLKLMLGGILAILIIWFGLTNMVSFFINDWGRPNLDPSLFKNEIAAIDYVYKYANGQNFKVYAYLPSVYDYPYQYLFWWYGQKRYGYIPGEYVYAPNKPVYIPSQNKFQGRKNNLSGLVFLIKEPDRNDTRSGWEGAFVNLEAVGKQMVGPLEIEVRKEIIQ